MDYFYYPGHINILVHIYNLISSKRKIKATGGHLFWPQKPKALVNQEQIYVCLNGDSCYPGVAWLQLE